MLNASPCSDVSETSHSTSRQFATLLAGKLKHPSDWLRQNNEDRQVLAALGRSYQDQPINLILVSTDGTVRDGNRRLEGILHAFGPEAEVRVVVTNEEITREVSLEIMLQTSEHTKALTTYEQFVGYAEWLKLTGKSAKDLAERLHQNESTVSRILALSKCVPAVHDAAKAGLIGPKAIAAISQLEPDEQPALLQVKLEGGTVEDMTQASKKVRSGKKSSAAPAVRAASIKCPLPNNGPIVVVKGDEISLEEAIEALAEAGKLMKAAASKGLNAKTAQNVWKDVAAAG